MTLKVLLRKEKEDGTVYKEPYFSSITVTVTNEDGIPDKLDPIEEEILELIATWISEGSGWIIEEILNHYINVVSYIPLSGNSYIPLPKELQHPMKGLIIINIRGQIENRPLQNTRSAGRKRLTVGC